MDEGEIGGLILDCATKVHKAIGPGLLESAYEACLAFELDELGVAYQRQLALPLVYQSVRIDAGYRIDLLVERKVVVEIKAVEQLTDVHRAQRLSYLRLGDFRLGYRLNFNVALMNQGVRRLANGPDSLRPLRLPSVPCG